MVDGITAIVVGVESDALRDNPLLVWKRVVREDDRSSLSNYCYAQYLGLNFKLFDSGLLKIQGSLHRFFNDGGPNSSTFTFRQLSTAIYELSNLVGVEPEKIELLKFEIGLNVSTEPKSAKNIVESALVFKKKLFVSYYKQNPVFFGKHTEYTDYDVKLYTKTSSLIRFEIASKRIRYYERFSIKSLADLIDQHKYTSLFHFLVKSFQKIIFFDRSNSIFFSEDKRWKYSSPEFWHSLNPYRRKAELAKYFTTLKQAGVIYIGDKIYHALQDLGPFLMENPDDISDFSILGLKRKNKKHFSRKWIYFISRSSLNEISCSGQAASLLKALANPGTCQGSSRIRSPPFGLNDYMSSEILLERRRY